jgi:hypothetical protein
VLPQPRSSASRSYSSGEFSVDNMSLASRLETPDRSDPRAANSAAATAGLR